MVIRLVHFGQEFKKSIRHQEELSRRSLEMYLEVGLRISRWKSSPSRWYLMSWDNMDSDCRWRECRWVLALRSAEVWNIDAKKPAKNTEKEQSMNFHSIQVMAALRE